MQQVFLFLAISLSYVSFCQDQSNERSLSGHVQDEERRPLAGVTLRLSTAEKKLIKILETDSLGNFVFTRLSVASYNLEISAIGYKEINIPIGITESPVLQKTIVLIHSTNEMAGIIIKTTKPLLEHRTDHINFNIASAPFLKGYNSLEAIGEAPGIEVTPDGTITYNRKNVLVLIDGKQTYLQGDALAAYLRGLMAGNIDHIEFYPIPPSRFDAGGGGPVINIITKRIKPGLRANFNTTYIQGRYAGLNRSFNLNYQRKKFGLLFIYNASSRQSYNQTTSHKNFLKNDTLTSIGDQWAFTKYKMTSQLVKGAVDYYLDKKTTLGFMLTSRIPQSWSNPYSQTNVSSPYNKQAYQENTSSAENSKAKNFLANINIKKNLDSTGTLTADMDYADYSQTDNQILNNQFYDSAGKTTSNLMLQSYVPVHIRIAVGEVNYDQQFPHFHLQSGIKSSWVQSDNDQQFFRLYNGVSEIDNRSNHFIYTERINAAFITWSKNWKKVNLSIGLRGEQTKGTGNQVNMNYLFHRDTFNLFPTSFFQWTINPKTDITISYGKRIGRPNYEQLNPFLSIQDSLNYFQGNPYLRPYYIYNYSFGYSYNNWLMTSFEYSDYQKISAFTTYYNPDNQVTLHSIENVNALKLAVLSINVNRTFWKKLNVNFANQFYQTYWQFTREKEFIQLRTNSYYGVLKLSENFSKGYGWQVEGIYATKSLDMLAYTGRRGYFNISLMKKILANNGLIKIDIMDPLGLFYLNTTYRYQDINEFDTNHFGNKSIRISFTYNFIKGNTKIKNRSTSSEELQSRLGK